MRGSPVVWEEFVEAAYGRGTDGVESFAEVRRGIDLKSLANGGQAGEDGGGSPAVIAT